MFTPSFPSVYSPSKKEENVFPPISLPTILYRYIQAYTVGQTRVLVYRVFEVKRLGQRKSSKKFLSVLLLLFFSLKKEEEEDRKSFRILVRLGSLIRFFLSFYIPFLVVFNSNGNQSSFFLAPTFLLILRTRMKKEEEEGAHVIDNPSNIATPRVACWLSK
jgi:hypothetical protein